MKETTCITTVEFTCIINHEDNSYVNMTREKQRVLEKILNDVIDADNIHVKSVQFFIRDIQ